MICCNAKIDHGKGIMNGKHLTVRAFDIKTAAFRIIGYPVFTFFNEQIITAADLLK